MAQDLAAAGALSIGELGHHRAPGFVTGCVACARAAATPSSQPHPVPDRPRLWPLSSSDDQWRGHHPLARSQLQLLRRQRGYGFSSGCCDDYIVLRQLQHRQRPDRRRSPLLAFVGADSTHLRLLQAQAPAAVADAFGPRLRRLRLRSTCGDSSSSIQRRGTAPTCGHLLLRLKR